MTTQNRLIKFFSKMQISKGKKLRIFFISDIDMEEGLVPLVSNKLEHVDTYKVTHESLHGFKRVDHG